MKNWFVRYAAGKEKRAARRESRRRRMEDRRRGHYTFEPEKPFELPIVPPSGGGGVSCGCSGCGCK